MELLPPSVVHVWAIDLDTAHDLPDVLTRSEQERASRFRFAIDAQRWTVSRKILRLVLAHYTGDSPIALSFTYGPYGKPELQSAALQTPHGLHFNLSHSQSRACIAVARDRAVGVDLEYERTDFSPSELGESCFSPLERDALRRLPSDAQFTLFFQIWTGKEAYIKTRGLGLSFPLHRLTILPRATDDAMQATDLTTLGTSNPPIQVCRLRTSPRFAAALAVEEDTPFEIVSRAWDDNFSITS